MPEPRDADLLFKALADPSRRKLLDLLHAHDGRTLNDLCEHLDMTRQGVTQHLGVLESANLVATAWRGREKLHFLNPVPLQEIYESWIAKFEKPRLKALADPSRRKLLDLLYAHDGRTLTELCEHLDMTRQGVTQHLDLLEAANLVATVRSGREKLHFLNPVPLQVIYERWIAKFEKPRLKALDNLKRRLEKNNG